MLVIEWKVTVTHLPGGFILLPEFPAKWLTFEGEVKECFFKLLLLLNCVLSEMKPFVNEPGLLEKEQTVHSSLCGVAKGHALHMRVNSNGGVKGWNNPFLVATALFLLLKHNATVTHGHGQELSF